MKAFITGIANKRKVDVSDVQRSYILSELLKAVSNQDRRPPFNKKLKAFLNTLDTEEIINLTGLISNDYRKNAVHSYTIKTDFEWHEVEASVDEVYLTQTNEKENVILASLPVPWNLKSIIEKIQKGETEGLEDFLDKGVETVELPIAIYEKINEKEDPKIKLIDGIHRTPSILARSKSKKLNLYLGINLSTSTLKEINNLEGDTNLYV